MREAPRRAAGSHNQLDRPTSSISVAARVMSLRLNRLPGFGGFGDIARMAQWDFQNVSQNVSVPGASEASRTGWLQHLVRLWTVQEPETRRSIAGFTPVVSSDFRLA